MKTHTLALTLAFALSTLASSTQAQTPLTPKAQWAADTQTALTRYQGDKKLCNDESNASTRLQCRREAKAQYDQALAAAKSKAKIAMPAPVASTQHVCTDCARVTAVLVGEKAGEGSALGMIAGGVGGALLGHQVGAGTGKDLATIAGALGGAYAGKKIEEKVKTQKVWNVSVAYANGNKAHFEFEQDPGFKVGDAVRNSGHSIVRQ